ncbi:hypothetical protein ACFL02_03405, partial [Planctomycetota bacterium]
MNHSGKAQPAQIIALLIILLVAICLLGGGCTSTPVKASGQTYVVRGDPNYIWLVCQEQLKKRGFRLDQVDRRRGIIRSFPLISKQWFEFWCQDVVTGEGLLESSLHTLRRTIRLEMATADKRQYSLRCQVGVERLSSERQIVSGRVRAWEILGRTVGRLPPLSGGDSRGVAAEQWLPVGEDHAL